MMRHVLIKTVVWIYLAGSASGLIKMLGWTWGRSCEFLNVDGLVQVGIMAWSRSSKQELPLPMKLAIMLSGLLLLIVIETLLSPSPLVVLIIVHHWFVVHAEVLAFDWVVVDSGCGLTDLFESLGTLIVGQCTLLPPLFLNILQVAHRLRFHWHASSVFPGVLEVIKGGIGLFRKLGVVFNCATEWFVGPDEALLRSKSINLFDMPVVWISEESPGLDGTNHGLRTEIADLFLSTWVILGPACSSSELVHSEWGFSSSKGKSMVSHQCWCKFAGTVILQVQLCPLLLGQEAWVGIGVHVGHSTRSFGLDGILFGLSGLRGACAFGQLVASTLSIGSFVIHASWRLESLP